MSYLESQLKLLTNAFLIKAAAINRDAQFHTADELFEETNAGYMVVDGQTNVSRPKYPPDGETINFISMRIVMNRANRV